MRTTLIAAILLGLIVLAAAHGHHNDKDKGRGHGKHEGKKHHKSACSYKDTKGHNFDLSRLNSKDMIVKDMVGGSTYHYNPCGSVYASACPHGAAVCEITNKGAAISYGLASDAHWADGVESGASLEVTYGSGELCPEGVHRKSVVEMRCMISSDPISTPSFLMGVIKEDCLLKLIVESPLACDKDAICAAITNEDTCEKNRDLCEWDDNLCVASTENKHHKWGSRQRITTIVVSAVIGFSAVVFLCCSICCACIACRRAARRRKLRGLPTHKKVKAAAKKAKKAEAKNAEEELDLLTPETYPQPVAVPEGHFPFQPFAMQQAADGSFVPVHMPMHHMQAPPHAYTYPMVQVVPTYHVQQEAQQQ